MKKQKTSGRPTRGKPLQPFAEAARIAVVYLVVGLLWITLSDMLIARIFPDKASYLIAETYKGWFYVVVTAVLLLLLVRNLVSRLRHQQEHLSELAEQRTAGMYEQELFRSRQLFKELIDHAPIGIYWKDTDGRYLGCNKAMASSLMATPEDIVGKTNRIFMDEEQARQNTELDRQVLASGTAHKNLQQMLITRRGERRFFNINKVPLHNEAGEVYALLGVLEDITEQKRRELDLVQAQKDASTASRAKSEFLSRMSHEIRTPLNSIIGLTHIALEADSLEKIKELLQKMDASSRHLLLIINDILDISRIEAGKMSVSSVVFDMTATVEETVGIILQRAQEKKQHMDLFIDQELPRFFKGDPVRLRQVLMNLLSNAVKFTPEQGAIAVRVGMLRKIDREVLLRFEVEDNGIGIRADQLELIFNPFEQADGTSTREYEGTGLGLSISKSIVELMGGEIRVTSTQGKGSVFAFTLPLELCAEGPPTLDVAFEDLRMLVVDDEPETCSYMEAMLRRFHVEVMAVQSGEEAVACAVEAKQAGRDFHVVFIDWNMPGMNGVETAQAIRKIGCNPIVIMFSMCDYAEIEPQARAAGISIFLPKPIFPSSLLNTLYRITGGPQRRPAQDRSATENIFAGKRILVAEDVMINHYILREMLAKTGAVLIAVTDGQQAFDAVCTPEAAFDAVLMDVQMPLMDGLEAARRIRSHPVGKKLPIIAMTANVFKEDIDKALLAGMDDHLGKPINREDLIEKLRKAMKL